MTFDDRWHALAAAARRAAEPALPPADPGALVRRALAARAAPPPAGDDWRGLAAAAGLCAACLAGLLAFAPVRGGVDEAFAALAQAPRALPATSFIPAPPRPPALAALSPADLAARVGGWFTAPSETTP